MPVPSTNPPGAAAPVLSLRGCCVGFGRGAGRREVLAELDFELAEGEIVAIVGFSGSGKTTLLSLMAGLLEPDLGQVMLQGRPARAPGPDRGVVFQSYALLPWLSAEANVRLAIDAVHPEWKRSQRRAEARLWLERMGLHGALRKRPRELSGGMRQRVAVARALALDPSILLLDEPLGALDALTRASLQTEIARICRGSRKSTVLITNDVDEAILMADRIVPLCPGPRATLGPSFPVLLPQPRSRAALQRDPEFRKLRTEISAFLLELSGRRKREHAAAPLPPLPPLQPIDLARRGARGIR